MRHGPILLSSFVLFAAACAHQNPESAKVTAVDYARAERFLAANTAPLVHGEMSRATWLTTGRLLYRVSVRGGHEYMVADPTKRTRAKAFDHVKLAKALSIARGTEVLPLGLDLRDLELGENGYWLRFESDSQRYSVDTRNYEVVKKSTSSLPRSILSPDGRRAAFIRDHNLWMRDVVTGHETQLTKDGVKDFGYATNNAGWTRSDTPVLTWSPDSQKIATFQHDGRGVGDMFLVSTQVGHPKLQAWKCPLPGDEHIFRIQRVIIHVDSPRVVRMDMSPDAHRSTTTDHVAGRNGKFLDVEWSRDSTHLAFVSSSRDHKEARLCLTNFDKGDVHPVLEETVKTYFESGSRAANWRVLNENNEVIWFSERSNWGHLYLYDLSNGELKNPITSGDWTVLQLRRVDTKERMLYFTAAGREPGDPYFQYLYRVRMNGKDLELLTPERANHVVILSPSGEYFVDTYSTPATPPVSVIRAADGTLRTELEKADISRLLASGWHPPIVFKVKARDGKTDLHGLMYKPTLFDESRSYPVLNYLYPGPQSGSVGSRSFSASRRDKQSVAELGFVVVEVDAMGTPGRSKSFHDAYYGNMGDNGLPDQITTIQQLATRHQWMDVDRVGIWGHSGGGFASTGGILRYPDFYKVAVSSAGNHDNRNYEDDWGEKWQGLLKRNPDDTTNYDNQANQLLVGNLKGKLLIAHGTLDTNVPPSNTMLVVNALIAANKDFDLLMFPNRGHGFGNEPYMMRRRWDYFVRHLHGVEPPKQYTIRTDTRRRR
jgi:dienelactone hydrolase/Tol biopolymer transport system component